MIFFVAIHARDWCELTEKLLSILTFGINVVPGPQIALILDTLQKKERIFSRKGKLNSIIKSLSVDKLRHLPYCLHMPYTTDTYT